MIMKTLDIFKKENPDDAPVGGFGKRIKNVFKTNYRGLLGVLVPFFGLIWQGEKLNKASIVKCTWIWMACCFFFQPVNIPVTGLIPIFVLPMTGIMNSKELCLTYMNESIAVFLLGTMINLLLNNSGLDRRIELFLLRSGNNSSYNPRKLVFKSATAAFVMSIFSNRLMVTKDVITFLAPTLLELKGSPDADFESVRAIFSTAVHVAASIGSCVFPHGSMCILYMRSQFYGAPKEGYDFPDVFNYMQYIIYAFPVALIMFLLSTLYFMVLVGGKTISPTSLAKIGGALNKHKADLPKNVTLHEKETIFFLLVFLILCITRWCKFMDMGWTTFAKDENFPTIPRIRDGSCCAILVLVLFALPKGFSFIKYLTAKKYKDLPPAKPESAILFWRYVDRNVQYGYIFLFGAGRAISDGCMKSGHEFDPLSDIITKGIGKNVTDYPWNLSIFIVCLVSVILGNIMPGIAAATIWTPFVVNMARDGAPRNWDTKLYLGLLGAGYGTSLGFMCPFRFTPAYFTHSVGKIPKVKMAKTAFGAVVICFIILWLSLCFFAPYLWDPNDDGGFVTIVGPDMKPPKDGDATPAPAPGPAPGADPAI